MLLISTRVGPSAIHGLGLFATAPVPRGTPVWRFVPGFDRVLARADWEALPEVARAHVRHFAFLDRAAGGFVCSGDHACFMNHAETPNTGAAPGAWPPILTVALRALAEGEELTCDYRAFDAEAAWKLGEVAPEAPPGTPLPVAARDGA